MDHLLILTCHHNIAAYRTYRKSELHIGHIRNRKTTQPGDCNPQPMQQQTRPHIIHRKKGNLHNRNRKITPHLNQTQKDIEGRRNFRTPDTEDDAIGSLETANNREFWVGVPPPGAVSVHLNSLGAYILQAYCRYTAGISPKERQVRSSIVRSCRLLRETEHV